jgi:hypothetical protein
MNKIYDALVMWHFPQWMVKDIKQESCVHSNRKIHPISLWNVDYKRADPDDPVVSWTLGSGFNFAWSMDVSPVTVYNTTGFIFNEIVIFQYFLIESHILIGLRTWLISKCRTSSQIEGSSVI